MMRNLLAFALLLLLTACDELEQVSHSGQGAFEASMAALPDGYAVAWYDNRDGNAEIYLRLLNGQGRPTSPEYRLTKDEGFSYEADIASVDGNLAIAWYERLVNGNLRAKLGLWTERGEARWTRSVSAGERDSRNTLVRVSGSELFSAWIEDLGSESAEVWGAWWNLNGEPLTQPRRLAPASRTTWNLNATVDSSGAAWIVFDARAETRNNELFLIRTDKTNTSLIRMTTDDGFASKYPDLALSGDSAALTWYDERDGNQEVYLAVTPIVEVREDMDQRARRITKTPGESIGAYVAWNQERVGLAWCDKSAGQHEIYFQSFNSRAAPLEPARRVTNTGTDSLIPAIKPSADAFALVWNEYAPKGDGHSGGRSEIVFTLARQR